MPVPTSLQVSKHQNTAYTSVIQGLDSNLYLVYYLGLNSIPKPVPKSVPRLAPRLLLRPLLNLVPKLVPRLVQESVLMLYLTVTFLQDVLFSAV